MGAADFGEPRDVFFIFVAGGVFAVANSYCSCSYLVVGSRVRLAALLKGCLGLQNPQAYQAGKVKGQHMPQRDRLNLHQTTYAKLSQVAVATVGVRKLGDRRSLLVPFLIGRLRHPHAEDGVLVRVGRAGSCHVLSVARSAAPSRQSASPSVRRT